MNDDSVEKAIKRIGENFVKLERMIFDKYSAAGIIRTGKTKKEKSQRLVFAEGDTPLEAMQKLEKKINNNL
jgi:hypothetical protein